MLVEESIHDEFGDAMIELADEQVVGYGLEKETDVGALIGPKHEWRLREYVETGEREGATFLHGGREVTVDEYENGSFLGPTVFRDVTPDTELTWEELFEPLLGIGSVSNLYAAIEWLNESEFGNAASLFTDRGSDAHTFRHKAEAGNLEVNVGTVAPLAFFTSAAGRVRSSAIFILRETIWTVLHGWDDLRRAVARRETVLRRRRRKRGSETFRAEPKIPSELRSTAPNSPHPRRSPRRFRWSG